MMVANSFDLWQKDAFFSAAEEVQESADVMESAYRMWTREKREGSKPEDLDQLSRELQTALGTAKWQLEEFERAVQLSRGHCSDDFTASRHKQFVTAIESQISLVEAALREAFSGEGKQPFRWVNLDKEECDDLAMFLSGTIQIPENVKYDCTTAKSPMKGFPGENHHKRKKVEHNSGPTCSRGTSEENEFITDNKNGEFIIDIQEKENLGMRDDIISQVDKTTGSRRTWSSPNFGSMKFMVSRDDKQRDKMKSSVEATPKEKWYKPFFWKRRCGEHSREKGSITLFNQLCGQTGGFQRQLQTPLHLQFSCSIQLTLALMLSIFLIDTVVTFGLNRRCGSINLKLLAPWRCHSMVSAFSSLFSLRSSITLLIIEVKGVLNFFLKCRKQALRRKITAVNIFPVVLEIQGPANLPSRGRSRRSSRSGLSFYRFHSHINCICIHVVSNCASKKDYLDSGNVAEVITIL
ncbi:hypothetical protein POTOM_025755 [Populus tomentosa]|uniref:Syntaxin 6/10/61 N-terminal domain-containing protein n=1 Tax=Populus tomentosa TaxID=118781 RepID=A0A8X7ZLQ8_POPTO|nr:hypothetical protein POTOM_025755 [Populus tomentosa]